MRFIFFSLLLPLFAFSANAQELRCSNRLAEPYINKQLAKRFGPQLSDADEIALIGRGVPYQPKAVWKSATAVSQQADGLLCSALVQLTRPDTGEVFDVTVEYVLQSRDGGTFVKVTSASRKG
jgi:hypothetical protein